MTNNLVRDEFLKKAGIDPSKLQQIKGDLSSRKFYRIANEERPQILMESNPHESSFHSFLVLTEFLAKHDFSVPEIYLSDSENGFILMEDFGIRRIGDMLSSNQVLPDEVDEEKIYKRSIDVLVRLQGIESPSNLVELDEDKYVSDSMKFITYYVDILNGTPMPESLRQEFDEIMRYLLAKAKIFKSVTMLRDYHVENLFWLFERNGIQKVGLIDYQDAALGSPVYDVVSILQDARRNISAELESKMISHYLKSFPAVERKDFLMAYCIFGVQRNLKIIGQFSYYAEKNKLTYLLQLLPRVIGYMKNDLNHPILLPLKKWLEKALPQKGVVSALTYGSGNTKIIV